MKFSKTHIYVALTALVTTPLIGSLANAEYYYFRLRPSIKILNQELFSVHIDGDREGVKGSEFSAKAIASSPRETLRFNVESGSLPPGVSLNTTSGDISGYPISSGRFTANIVAHDAFSTANATMVATIYDSLEIGSTIAQYATVGKPYSSTFLGHGGDQNYSWTLTGSIPPGLSFSNGLGPSSALSGVPTGPGTWSGLTVNLSDTASHTISTSPFSITVADQLKISGVASGIATVGIPYSASFASSGGHAPIHWTLSGALPQGLTFNDGVISGTPTQPETTSGLVVRISDDAGNTDASTPFSITVTQPLSVSGTPANFGTVGGAYSASLTAIGGDENYRWESAGGTLPPGLNFANGVISGTPSGPGTWENIVFRVTDGNGRTADSQPISITVSNPLAISGSSSFIATVGIWTYTDFAISGGDGNYKVSVFSGTQPPGFYPVNGPNDGYGFYRGTPTQAGTWSNIILRVTDGAGRSANSNPFSITVAPNVVREPASGEYYEKLAYHFCYYDTAVGEIRWGGSVIPLPAGVTQYSYGGATYYRGNSSYGRLAVLWGCTLYSIYRTVP